MKRVLSFLVLATMLVSFSSCFQKYREPEADDGTGVSAASKWDWKGTAPFSGILGGEQRNAPTNSTIPKSISNKAGIITAGIIEPLTNDGRSSRTYGIALDLKLKPGIYILSEQSTTNFQFTYSPAQEPVPGKPMKAFSKYKLVVKLIRNDDDVVEGYFYGKIVNLQNTAEIMEVKDAYFRIEKSGATIID